ncbi:MAG: sigma-70 family RNA polymerase sigma factor [Gemmataceae bacterium]|nr:sigma-70 family RNA polymerase sigma factor [Gemmataceae bacterium]
MSDSHDATIAGLLTRAREGDADARDRLFTMCRNYVNIVARTHVESWLQAKVDASDLVQQTLLEAHRDFRRFQGATEGEWLAWLRQILSHNASDFIRQYYKTAKRAARREVVLGNPDHSSVMGLANVSDGGESPSQQLLRKERELQLADAIAGLTPDHREVIILRNLQRLPFEDVAQRMGRSRPAVQMLWMRAIQKLQEALDGGLSHADG